MYPCWFKIFVPFCGWVCTVDASIAGPTTGLVFSRQLEAETMGGVTKKKQGLQMVWCSVSEEEEEGKRASSLFKTNAVGSELRIF